MGGLTQPDPFAPLTAELAAWSETGRAAPLWLRDDDAALPTPALDRLLALSAAAAVPVTLAVIPATTGKALAARLAAAPGVSVAVHGWRHANHAPPGRKSAELGPERPAATILGELSRGRARLAHLFPAQAIPLLVPPWNRIDPGLLPPLPALGFRALSTFGPEPPDQLLPFVNTHADLIDWRGTRGGREPARLVAELVARLGALRGGAAGVAGLLTHHLVHDEAAWAFLEDLFVATRRAGASWLPAAALPGLAAPA
ncbi:MAG: polysaccharide deacetylase family protein [Paracoccaceae bacterium]